MRFFCIWFGFRINTFIFATKCAIYLWHFVFFFSFVQFTVDSRQNSASDFQMVFDDCFGFVSGVFNSSVGSAKYESQFLDANENYPSRPSVSPRPNITFPLDTISEEEEDEPPLLEELEIYPEQIMEKAMTIINPFKIGQYAIELFLADIDLSGPLFFCFLFGACLFLAGKVYIFSHVYGLSMVSVLGMYVLLKLMCHGHQEHFITIRGVASALGYGMLHLVWLSFIGIFCRFNTIKGLMLVSSAIVMSTVGASRILSLMSNQSCNVVLIAYPTAMIYILFTFLVTYWVFNRIQFLIHWLLN